MKKECKCLQNGFLEQLYKIQEDTQKNVYNIDSDDLTIGELIDLIIKNDVAERDEMFEILEAIGGKYKKASWKFWKKDYPEVSKMKLSDLLSSKEKDELMMEIVDKFMFITNMLVYLGISPQELIPYMKEKDKINRNRQKNGY